MLLSQRLFRETKFEIGQGVACNLTVLKFICCNFLVMHVDCKYLQCMKLCYPLNNLTRQIRLHNYPLLVNKSNPEGFLDELFTGP
jgi:hypothetical protein